MTKTDSSWPKEDRIAMIPSSRFAPKDIFEKKDVHLKKELVLTGLGLAVTLAATYFALAGIGIIFFSSWQQGAWIKVIEQAVFGLVVVFLVYGNVLYQLTRMGYFLRLTKFQPVDLRKLDHLFKDQAPRLTVLIPSYKEELRVIRQSILSSALQEYPSKRVVLLIDDPTHPRNPQDLQSLNAVRNLPRDVQMLLDEQKDKMVQHRNEYLLRKKTGTFNSFAEAIFLCGFYDDLAQWYLHQGNALKIEDHGDELSLEKIFLEPARYYNELAEDLGRIAMAGRGYPTENEFDLAYQKLVGKFNVEIVSFERKRYENLSHEPNKAMNLNSYIALLGKSFAEARRNGKIFLEEADSLSGQLHVPSADFLITLDADSILSFDYAIRLIDVMQQPGHERLAVVQTPYSAVPNPPGVLERIAGATTDMQYLIHQGFTYHQATYWVGANALLRVAALQDIREELQERGFTVSLFIQDRTVIEDTESSVDLVAKGWKLFNYPRRLSYSATPPDFGSLLIQRRRWANGGLIIFPKLWRYLMKDFNFVKRFGEGFMRIHYLTSIAAVNIGLPLLMIYPFDDNLSNPWLPLTAIPYYFFYGRDLIQAGYVLKDLFRVYALNLLLIPVNLGGVFKSIEQALTKERIPFKRTPKVQGRTTAPVSYLVIEFLILVNFFLGAAVDAWSGRLGPALCGLVNGLFFFYAVKNFIGFKNAWEDIQTAFQKSSEQRSRSESRCLCPECSGPAEPQPGFASPTAGI